MKIVNFAKQNTVINQYVAELRDVNIQKDRARFRRNLGRIGQLIAYEVSKTLRYSEKTVQTPLALAKVSTMEDEVVLATIFRAGLPFHQGFLEVFDHADNGFVSAYRYYRDKECKTVDVKVEYIASPDLTTKFSSLPIPCSPRVAVLNWATMLSSPMEYQHPCIFAVPLRPRRVWTI